MSRKCPHCGEQVGQMAKNCWRCGGSLDVSYAGGVPTPVGGGEYRSPVTNEQGGPTGRQKAVGWICIVLGVLVPATLLLGIATRGLPSGSTYTLVIAMIVTVGLIIQGIRILRSKTSDINLFRWDLGRK